MLAAAVKALDDGAVLLRRGPLGQIAVDGLIGHAHLLLIGLAVKEACGRGLFNDAARGAEEFQESDHLGGREVRNRIEVMGAVTPLGIIAHIALTAVAGPGDQKALGSGNGIERRHAQARGNIRYGKVRHVGHALQRLQLGGTDRCQVDRPGLDPVLTGKLAAVFGIAAEISAGSAGHDDADRVVAGGLAENAHQRAVLAAGIAEDNAFCAGAVHKVPNPGNAAVVFLLPVSGDHGFPSFCFSTLSNTPGRRKSQDFSAPDFGLLHLRGSGAELSPADSRAAHICLG